MLKKHIVLNRMFTDNGMDSNCYLSPDNNTVLFTAN